MKSVDYEYLFLRADNLRRNGQLEKSLSEYATIAKIAEESGSRQEVVRALCGAAQSCFTASASMTPSKYRDGMLFLHRAAEIARESDETALLTRVYCAAAEGYVKLGLFAQALEYAQKSIEICTQNDYYGELGAVYTVLASYYLSQKQYEATDSYLQKALSCFKKDPTEGFLIATALLVSARYHLANRRYLEASELAEQSLSWFQADHDGEQYGLAQAELEGILSMVARPLGKEGEVRKHASQYSRLLSGVDATVARSVHYSLEQLAT